jgi:dynein heavy chain, axonemal
LSKGRVPAQVSSSIKNNQLQEYADRCTSDLFKVVTNVRGRLTKLQRATLSALIVVDVHARDVVQDLANSVIVDESDFEWTSQLRYTWEDGQVRTSIYMASLIVKWYKELPSWSCMHRQGSACPRLMLCAQ